MIPLSNSIGRLILKSRQCKSYMINIRVISTTDIKMEKAMKQLEQNPFYEKYASRIAALQKTAPEEFVKRVDHQMNSKMEQKPLLEVDTRQFSSVLNPKKSRTEVTGNAIRHLDDIFKVDLVQEKDASEIKVIWEDYHKNKEVISATIPTDIYAEVQEHMKQFPVFIFPLPRSQGYEFIVSQNCGHSVHFTPLLAYQVHKENAPECLTMVHYVELCSKGIVLMRGDYDKNVLNGKEAQCLANQFQMYYSGKDQTKLNLLENFNKSPDSFKHMNLIAQLENIGL